MAGGPTVKTLLRGVVGALAAFAAITDFSAAQTENIEKVSDKAVLADLSIEDIFVETSAADSSFIVVDSRFDETATAGAIFGLGGALINSGINASEDDKKADRFRKGAAAIDLSAILMRSTTDRLTARANPPVAASKEEGSHVLLLEIRNWGLTRTERGDPRLRTFLNLSWRILDAKGDTVFEKKRENVVSPTMRRLDEFTDEIIKSEMESLAAKSGQQIAFQIIYR